ncbi:hypothetical protein ES705_10409 [subsurface metagenome]
MNNSMVEHIMRKLVKESTNYENRIFLPEAAKAFRRISSLSDVANMIVEACPKDSFGFILRYGYPFARLGGERANYREIAFASFKEIEGKFNQENFSELLWSKFKEKCEVRNVGINKKINENLVKRLSRFAQDKGNLFLWVKREIEKSERLESVFLSLVNNGGMGKKTTSFFLRDVIWLCNLENNIIRSDRLYVQPVDRWIREIAKILWDDFKNMRYNNDYFDLVISKRIAETCIQSDLSGLAFNQGAWYYGSNVVKRKEDLHNKLQSLLSA